MLPSRGVIRSGQAMRLRQMATQQSRAGCARNFATALRKPGGLGRPAMSIAQLSGRRIGLVNGAPTTLPSSMAAFSLFPWRSKNASAEVLPEGAVPEAAVSPQSTATASTASTPSTPSAPSTPITPSDAVQPDTLAAADPTTTAASVSDLLDGGALLDMPEQIGYLHAMGLDFGWGPSSMCMWLLEHVHVYTGLPWWASIGLTVLLFRSAIFFPSLTAAEQSARFQKLRADPKYAAAMTEMQQSAMRGGQLAQGRAMELRMTTKRMQAAAGVSTWKMFIPMINVPFGYGMFRLLRSMALLPVPALETDGLLWFQDLTVPDPFFVLPIASATIMYLIFRNNIKYMAPEQAQLMKMMQIVITPVSILVTVKMSAGLTLFFFLSSVLQMVQTWLWHQPWLRTWKGLPPLHTLIQTPGVAKPAASSTTLRLSPASTWQAPRAISTSATVTASGSEAAKPAGPPSTVDVVKKGWNKMMGTAKDKQGASKDKQTFKAALEYEKKRAAEEEESLYRRREAERQYREMKKAMARGTADKKP
ncbi:mitochondrial export translocase [Grosmannia clavigera kw1407]|uniref:Mitochondrial export translocase n=1 Tax=Grosmannia clavigera (strain kw1407 / UAMH 11150) TaxID=655863 RepID=F0XJM9_GROCL|nr:mitochondrial export translocase [Grosmannia clavigera kw1407]EFX02035.1 mitochondrial export translocase [Grosmannia clavigera kw1407]